jgi:monoamine oxidase
MPNALLCFVAGADAIYIETLSDECLMDVICELFTKCFPKMNLAKPRQILRSSWASDPFARGSYTYMRAGSTISDCKTLATPIVNISF